jgi:hypothetical protein
MKQIKLEEAEGKALTASALAGENAVLVFGDEFVFIEGKQRHWEDSPTLDEVPFDWHHFSWDLAIRLGLLTQEAIDAHKAEDARLRSRLIEARDREDYRRLKAKFEGTP